MVKNSRLFFAVWLFHSILVFKTICSIKIDYDPNYVTITCEHNFEKFGEIPKYQNNTNTDLEEIHIDDCALANESFAIYAERIELISVKKLTIQISDEENEIFFEQKHLSLLYYP